MTLKDFRDKTMLIPDDTELVVWREGEMDYGSVDILDKVLGVPTGAEGVWKPTDEVRTNNAPLLLIENSF